MKGKPKVLSALNEVLTAELTSINQYFLHARILKNMGLSQLNDKCYKKSIKDMKQADALIERILLLEGLPNLQHLDKLLIGEHTQEMLECDYKFQDAQIKVLKAAIALCEQEQDYVSRDLLDDLLKYEEDHADWLETQFDLINSTGIENYQQSML